MQPARRAASTSSAVHPPSGPTSSIDGRGGRGCAARLLDADGIGTTAAGLGQQVAAGAPESRGDTRPASGARHLGDDGRPHCFARPPQSAASERPARTASSRRGGLASARSPSGTIAATPSITASRTTWSIPSPLSNGLGQRHRHRRLRPAAGSSTPTATTTLAALQPTSTRPSNSRPRPSNTRTAAPTRRRSTRLRCSASSARQLHGRAAGRRGRARRSGRAWVCDYSHRRQLPVVSSSGQSGPRDRLATDH